MHYAEVNIPMELGAEVGLVPKLFRAEVTRAEHRLPPRPTYAILKKKLKRVGKHSLGQIFVENSGPKTQKII